MTSGRGAKLDIWFFLGAAGAANPA
jgi:hypothetical protein